VAGLIAAASISAGAADDPESIIKERREFMKGNGGHMKAINDALEAGDLTAIPEHATALRDGAKKIPDLFPEGTSMTEFPGKTGAKPEIWTEWDKFKQQASYLEEEAGELLEATGGGDKATIAAAFENLGKEGCGGCHQPFRQKLEE
jgi:cytochrome c556